MMITLRMCMNTFILMGMRARMKTMMWFEKFMRELTHACFGAGWSGATDVDDFGKNCWITFVEAAPLPFVMWPPTPMLPPLRLNATGVDGTCLVGYCLMETFDPLLSDDRINSRSIYTDIWWEEGIREKRWEKNVILAINLFRLDVFEDRARLSKAASWTNLVVLGPVKCRFVFRVEESQNNFINWLWLSILLEEKLRQKILTLARAHLASSLRPRFIVFVIHSFHEWEMRYCIRLYIRKSHYELERWFKRILCECEIRDERQCHHVLLFVNEIQRFSFHSFLQ